MRKVIYIRNNTMKEIEQSMDLELDISKFLKEFLDDYSGDIENNLMDEIKMDVMLCSAYQEGYWNKTDIKLAVGRVLCKNLGIER